MNSVLAFSLIAAASAFTNDKAAQIHQNPIFNDACPSTLLLNGECQGSTMDPSSGNISAQQNSTQEKLQESYDSAQRIADFPWSHWPECFSNENTTEPYCVFSDQKFASGRGIFIVTTSVMAYEMLNKPAFRDPKALQRINNHDNPPFVEHEFPIKGRGLVANKTLHRGDQIFASTPLLITNPDTYLLAQEERLKLLHRGLETLPEATKPLFWGLLDHFKGDPVDDRINTNAFEIEINGHIQHAVLPEIAMMNHDCRPNAAYFWDEETLSHYVHATQTIYPGQEITITYINNERSREKRMENLKANWGFDCDCSSCSAHPSFYAESDSRIQRMEVLAEQLNDWTPESKATPEIAEALISMYEQERLSASMGSAYKLAAEVYASFGDKYNAIKYASLSIELNMLDKGFRDRDVMDMKGMVTNPEMSWSWKKRIGSQRLDLNCGYYH
jgi:hypothetical protein